MDCRTAQILIELVRPAEVDASEGAALESHLAGCPLCAERARTVYGVDALLGVAMRDVPIPEGLRNRLLDGLALDMRTSQRGRWLRQLGNLAAAAALLLAVSLAWIHRGGPARIDTEHASEVVALEIANPCLEHVEDWLKSRHVMVPAPENFDYRLLQLHEMAELQGQRVPLLVFVRTENQRTYQARVYLLSAEQFNLAPTPDAGSICTSTLMPHPTNPRYAYLVVYTGDLDGFLAKEQQTTT